MNGTALIFYSILAIGLGVSLFGKVYFLMSLSFACGYLFAAFLFGRDDRYMEGWNDCKSMERRE